MYRIPQSCPHAEDQPLLQNMQILEFHMLNFWGPCLCFACFAELELMITTRFGALDPECKKKLREFPPPSYMGSESKLGSFVDT